VNATQLIKGLTKNKHDAFASPAVRHTLAKVHHMSNADRKIMVPELQRASAVENIAANFVASGNHEDLVQELLKLTSTATSSGDSPPPAKKAKKQSNRQCEDTANRAMIASNVNTSWPTKPQ
jgi:hypothetical protein